MDKINTLILLVRSLSKGEKRYFRLHSSLQDGEKDYLDLFEFIEQGIEAHELKNLFFKKRPKASYEATSKYLFKVITDSILHLRSGKDMTTKLVTALLKVNIMFERSLYAEGFKQLQKIQASAETLELYIIELWAARLELYYISNLNFYVITEPELIQKQMKIQRLLKYANNIHQHTSLYELLKHRLLHKGGVRTVKQKAELNDLVVSELNLISNPLAETFESYKTHLLFQAHYFITISDYKSALKTFYELNDLFNEHNNMDTSSPDDYLSTIEGILDSLHTIKHYDEMQFFIDKLQNLETQSAYYEVITLKIIFIYKTTGFLYRGEFKEAAVFKDEFKETLLKKIHLLDISKQAEIYLYISLIYIGLNDMNKAHFYLNHILLESKLYHSLPIYRTFRLIHLLVHYELGNHDYIRYETRSIKRGLSEGSPHKSYLLEKIIFKFINQPIRGSGNQARLAIWDKIKSEFKDISSDKYETQILKIFDFSSWIEAKLTKKSFSGLLKEKYMLNPKY